MLLYSWRVCLTSGLVTQILFFRCKLKHRRTLDFSSSDVILKYDITSCRRRTFLGIVEICLHMGSFEANFRAARASVHLVGIRFSSWMIGNSSLNNKMFFLDLRLTGPFFGFFLGLTFGFGTLGFAWIVGEMPLMSAFFLRNIYFCSFTQSCLSSSPSTFFVVKPTFTSSITFASSIFLLKAKLTRSLFDFLSFSSFSFLLKAKLTRSLCAFFSFSSSSSSSSFFLFLLAWATTSNVNPSIATVN